jgi:hypothetical protein
MKKLLVAVALIAAFGMMMTGCKKAAEPAGKTPPPVDGAKVPPPPAPAPDGTKAAP